MKRSTRRAAVLGLCGSFAVVPIFGLIHQPPPSRVALHTAEAHPPVVPAADVRSFIDRASRSSYRIEDVVDATPSTDVLDGLTPSAATTTTVDPPSPPVTTGAPVRRRIISTTTTTRPRPTTTTTTRPAHSETGGGSWYDAPAGTCAMNDAPIGAVVTVTDLATGRSVTCQVNSPGPFYDGRIIDLSRTTFSQLAPNAVGVIQVRVTW